MDVYKSTRDYIRAHRLRLIENVMRCTINTTRAYLAHTLTRTHACTRFIVSLQAMLGKGGLCHVAYPQLVQRSLHKKKDHSARTTDPSISQLLCCRVLAHWNSQWVAAHQHNLQACFGVLRFRSNTRQKTADLSISHLSSCRVMAHWINS